MDLRLDWLTDRIIIPLIIQEAQFRNVIPSDEEQEQVEVSNGR